MTKVVVGDYQDVKAVETRVRELTEGGYPMESITIIANQAVMEDLSDLGVVMDTDFDFNQNDESVWQRIKHSFNFKDDEGESYRSGLDAYRQDILAGNILVLIDNEKVPAEFRDNLTTMDTGYWDDCANRVAQHADASESTAAVGAPDTGVEQTTATDNETIRLQEERLKVDKESVQVGEVVISKRVVEQIETIDVPVKHEEIVVERLPVTDGTTGTHEFNDETIVIPLTQEKVQVTKQPVVVEEVHVSKQNVENVEAYSASLRKEELNIGQEGNVIATEEDVQA